MTADQESGLEVSISALEHYSYCPRQCALIQVEQTFDENVFTVRGRLAHARVDSAVDTISPGVRFVRGAALWSDRLALRGRADLIELRDTGPFPVEYKVGPLRGQHAEVQLCAQALCLEEMTGSPVTAGAIFSFASRRRYQVAVDANLREGTLRVIEEVRGQLVQQELPPAVDDARCVSCSLQNVCLPSLTARPALVRGSQRALFRPQHPSQESEDDV